MYTFIIFASSCYQAKTLLLALQYTVKLPDDGALVKVTSNEDKLMSVTLGIPPDVVDRLMVTTVGVTSKL